MKYSIITLLIVAFLSVFSVQDSFAIKGKIETPGTSSFATYSELEKSLEEFCKDFVAAGAVVKVSIKDIDAILIQPRDYSDRAVSLELIVDSKQKFIFFESIIDDKNEESRLKEILRFRLTIRFSQEEKDDAANSFDFSKLERAVEETSLDGLSSVEELGEEYALILEYKTQVLGNMEYVALYETVGLITSEMASELRVRLNVLSISFGKTSDNILQKLKK